jgi:hypothetical protein
MNDIKIEKWQEALNKWDIWINAIHNIKERIQKFLDKEKFDSLAQLFASVKVSFNIKTEEDGVSIISVDYKENKASELAFNIHNIVINEGSKFLVKSMSLRYGLYFHQVFLDYWVKSILGYGIIDEFIQKQTPRSINLASKEEGKRIINTITWYQDEYRFSEVKDRLERLEDWPIDETTVRNYSKGGRPEKGDREDIESILACVMRYKYEEKLEDIANKFGWATYRDSQGKPMSNTLLQRLKRGRKLIKDNNIELPTKN